MTQNIPSAFVGNESLVSATPPKTVLDAPKLDDFITAANSRLPIDIKRFSAYETNVKKSTDHEDVTQQAILVEITPTVRIDQFVTEGINFSTSHVVITGHFVKTIETTHATREPILGRTPASIIIPQDPEKETRWQ